MRLTCMFLLGLSAAPALAADTITLKDGAVIQGAISRYEKGKFTVDEGGKPRIVRTTDVESIDFDGAAAAGAVAPAKPNAAPVAAAMQPLEGDDLDAWKLARSHIATNHDNWMPDNAMPIRDAIQVTPTDDYLVAIPVATKPEPGFGQQYGIFIVQVAKFGTSRRVDGDEFRKTHGPFSLEPPKAKRKAR